MQLSFSRIHTTFSFRQWLFIIAIFTLPIRGSAQNNVSVENGSINITSRPEGAIVYFDSVAIGKTPIDKFKAESGKHALSIELANYVTKETRVVLTSGKEVNYSTVLLPAFGFLNVGGTPKNTRMEFDSGIVCTGDISGAQISTGWHTIDISNPDVPSPISDRINISSGMLYEYQFRSSLSAPIQSALIPGLGQFMAGSYTKGGLEFGVVATAAYYMVKYITLTGRRERDLQTALLNYALATNEIDAIAAHKIVSDGVTRLKRSQDIRTISTTAFIAGYLLTIADALIFHTSKHLILENETMLGYPSLINFSRSPTVRIGIKAPIH